MFSDEEKEDDDSEEEDVNNMGDQAVGLNFLSMIEQSKARKEEKDLES